MAAVFNCAFPFGSKQAQTAWTPKYPLPHAPHVAQNCHLMRPPARRATILSIHPIRPKPRMRRRKNTSSSSCWASLSRQSAWWLHWPTHRSRPPLQLSSASGLISPDLWAPETTSTTKAAGIIGVCIELARIKQRYFSCAKDHAAFSP